MGSSGGGGGGSSGAVNYPQYMKEAHHDLITGVGNSLGGEAVDFGAIELMNYCMRTTPVTVTASPYSGLSATDPDTVFFDTAQTIANYRGQSAFELLELFLAETPESLYTAYATDTGATTMIAAFTTDLDAQYNNTIVSSMAAGYADLNAHMSSAYSIGLAAVAAQKTREVANFTGQIKTGQALQRMQMKTEWRRALSMLSVENGRIYLAAKHEEDETNVDYESKDNLWDLDLMVYGNNTLASIAGASESKGNNYKPSTLGAALSGAAAGAAAGSPFGLPGVIVGGAIGASAGYTSAGGDPMDTVLGLGYSLTK